MTQTSPQKTPLYDVHVATDGRMVEFAGYRMPLNYRDGIMREHLHTRAAASVFDVSHMGQSFLLAEGGRVEAAKAIETVVPADIVNLKPGQQRYTQLLNAQGGIIDDFMVTSSLNPAAENGIALVVNASRKDVDYDCFARQLSPSVRIVRRDGQALVALQGPASEAVLGSLCPDAAKLSFMQTCCAAISGIPAEISRSGYTGEDGFEISVAAADAEGLWKKLASDPRVRPAGLGARDSLRLEAGLCLYGNDLDDTTSPIEAALAWSIQKRRRQEGGFVGAPRVLQELAAGPSRVRVGIVPEGKASLRSGAKIFKHAVGGSEIGVVTSGAFGPSVQHPVSMGYVPAELASVGTRLFAELRGQRLQCAVVPMPFFPHRFKR